MRALVTGGAGFLGRAIIRRLLERGDRVRSFSRGQHTDLELLGVECLRGDVADAQAVSQAAEGCDVVFHVAARVGGWGPRREFERTNVTGTENVIAACRGQAVARLVFTSTPSVVHPGQDIEGADESLPYPQHFSAAYPATKAEAERLVLSANHDALATVALRPHLIWGPGDTQLIPRLLERARTGRLRLIDGGHKLIDATWIEDAAQAHVLAADALRPDARCAGRAYFIAQDDPTPARDLVNGVLEAADLPPVTASIPSGVARFAGALAELVWRLGRRSDEPPLTRFAAEQLGTAHWYDLSAARRDLGYRPSISTTEGLRQLQTHFKAEAENARGRAPKRDGARHGSDPILSRSH